ncbi:PREDICTED: leucine-rich repeat-containing protein 25 [Thamnophis sirtalis]|uniref:Leucine-rich repeat-containing protein 25 n=1 Tax=Thamnophis sirtalis TaxID=35019 RepID=A0A6I9YPW9_9SAUR|nr:PREDICTED: leucine-rich repeat-containing protein 25 [Thamnophis sirtalis]
MWGLLATLLFFPLGCLVDGACPRTVFNHFNETPCLNLSIQNPYPKVNFTMWKLVKELDLSNNNIPELSELESPKKLESLFLHNNKLKKLPSDFFDKTPKLKVLHLEKNQLGSLSIEVSYHCLQKLRVDCHCMVASGILDYCHHCSNQSTQCQCFTSGRLDNVTDYHKNSCFAGTASTRYGLYVGIIVPILILLLLAILAFLVIRRKKGATINQEKRPSSASEGTSGQSRYISRLPQPRETCQDAEFQKNYENVLNEQSKGKAGKMKSGHGNHQNRKQAKAKRSPSEGENGGSSEGHQPVYANTQELYYNYGGQPVPEAVDDVYIIPDQ